MKQKIKQWLFSPPKSKKSGLTYLSVYMLMLPMLAHATVIETLNNFLNYLTGGWGKAVSGLVIVAVGIGCLGMGKIPKGYLIAVVIGVGIIFGTKALLTMLGVS